MKYNTARPYIASFVIVRKDNKVAFVLRENTKWMNGYYGLPSGKIEKSEQSSAAAIREAKEEIGIIVKAEHLKHLITIHRQEPGEIGNEWIDFYFEVAEWEGEPYNAEPHMHSKLAWLDIDNLPENIIPSVRDALLQIKAGKAYGEYGWGATT